MKLIDLFVKIANGEEVPEKIKYLGIEFSFQHNCIEYINDYGTCLIRNISSKSLNEEVKIIEDTPKEEIQVLSRWYPPKEDKKIEKLNLEFDDGFIKEHFIGSSVSYLSEYTTLKMLYEKQCEIIDKINKEK